MAYDTNGRLYEISFPYHHTAAPVSVPANIQSLSVPHLSSLSYTPLIPDPMALMKPAVLPVVPNAPPTERFVVNVPDNLYNSVLCESEPTPCDEDMVTTCCHCGNKNYTMDIIWKKAKIKLKNFDELMNILRKQIIFQPIPSVSSAANQPTSLPAGMVCPPAPPPDVYNLKSNLSATAQEFRPIQNQKANVHVDETQNTNKDAYMCRVALNNDESQSRLPNEPLDTNDSAILESGIDSGVHDSGVSDSGVTDPTITDSAAERFVPNDDTDIANACNACESDSLKNEKDGKKRAKKKRAKQRSQKSNDGSMDNLVSDANDDAEFLNQNSDVYYNQTMDVGRPQQNDIKSLNRGVKPSPKSHLNDKGPWNANDTDWSKSTQKTWNSRTGGRRDEMDQRNGQLERDHQTPYTDIKSQRGPKNTVHRRNDANSCELPMPGKPRDGRVSSGSRKTNTNSNNNYSYKKSSKSYNAVVQEVDGNLFNASPEYSLAHCVAEDFRMGAGIAVTFKREFHGVVELLDQRKTVGEVAVLERGNRFIFYLITKQFSNGKPTLETIRQAIKSLKEECLNRRVKKLAMPRIGSGLDRLPWKSVREALNEEFSATDIEVVVYNFREEEESAEMAPSLKKIPPPHAKAPTVCYREIPLVKIEPLTALVVYGTRDGHMDKVCEAVNTKYPFKDVYVKSCSKHSLGDVISIPFNYNDITVFVLIARENSSEQFSFKYLDICLRNLNSKLKDLCYQYVGFEFLEDENDPTFNEKVLTLFRNNIYRKIEIHACNAKSNDERNATYSSQNSNNDSPKFTTPYPRRS